MHEGGHGPPAGGAPRGTLGRRALAVLASVAVLATVPASPSQAATTFTFHGSGYGHGVGLSQWGAYGLALQGWTFRQILRHFYTGTTVGRTPFSPSRLRIGLTEDRRTVHLTAQAGPVLLREGSRKGTVVGGRAMATGETWTVQVRDSGRFRVLDQDGRRLGRCPDCRGRLWGGVDSNLYATYSDRGGRVRLAESGHTYNRGWIELDLYPSGACTGGYCQRQVISLTPQHYLYGLAEVPSSWPAAALRAQAVAARTYGLERVRRLGQHRPGCNCALRDDTTDQVYAGWDKEGGPSGSRWVEAVDATDGLAVLYGGDLIQAYYHASSGGFTEDSETVWVAAVPYLRGVCDPGDYSVSPYSDWQVGPLSARTVTDLLRPYTGAIGTVQDFTGVVRGVSGRIDSLTVVGSTGQATISGTELRWGLGLRDTRVWINSDRNVTGAIRDKYDRLGCAPGLPTGRQRAVAGGDRQRFADGAIYWNQARGRAHWLHGPVYEVYRDLGESGGLLGMPRSDTVMLGGPGCGGGRCARARFEGGRISYKESLGAHVLYGAVLDYFLQSGGEAGHLGFPATDVVAGEDGSERAQFEHGSTVTCSGGVCVEEEGPADLALSVSDDPDPVAVGGTVTYQATVANGGPSLATSVALTLVLPPSATLVSASPTQGTCAGTGPVSCDLGSLGAGEAATVTVQAALAEGGPARTSVEVAAAEDDPDPSDNTRDARTLACTLIGTPEADDLAGTDGPDVICGLGGDDTVRAGGGADLVYAGPGADLVLGGGGSDTLHGEGGPDTVAGGSGDDRLYGDRGDDSLDGGSGTDTCRQGAGRGTVARCEG